jgi:AraC family transcriptional regulator
VESTGREKYRGTVSNQRKLTNFALVESTYAAGQTLSWHSHEQAFVSITLQGSYTEEWSSSTLYCHAGQVIFHVAGEKHSNKFFGQGGRSLNLEILPRLLERMKDLGMKTDRRATLWGSEYTQLGLRIHAEACRNDSASELIIEGLVMEMLGELLRRHEAVSKIRDCNWLDEVREVLHDRFAEPLALRDLAEIADVHPVHLARAFRKRFDCSIGDYLRKIRVAAACRDLANSDMSITEIAGRNGFSDQSHLCRVVKQYTGASPREHRSGEN